MSFSARTRFRFSSLRKLLRERSFGAGARVFRDAFQILVGQQALGEGRKRDAADAEFVEGGQQAFSTQRFIMEYEG
jgi:hypothetical protein